MLPSAGIGAVGFGSLQHSPSRDKMATEVAHEDQHRARVPRQGNGNAPVS